MEPGLSLFPVFSPAAGISPQEKPRPGRQRKLGGICPTSSVLAQAHVLIRTRALTGPGVLNHVYYFFFLPFGTELKVRRFPVAVLSLAVINFLYFVLFHYSP